MKDFKIKSIPLIANEKKDNDCEIMFINIK